MPLGAQKTTWVSFVEVVQLVFLPLLSGAKDCHDSSGYVALKR